MFICWKPDNSLLDFMTHIILAVQYMGLFLHGFQEGTDFTKFLVLYMCGVNISLMLYSFVYVLHKLQF